MPRLKQPGLLRDVTMDFMVKFLSTCCEKCSKKGSMEELRRCISFIKDDIGPHIPWELSPKFHDNFLTNFLRPDMDLNHQRVALEIIMDRKIIGLKCTYKDALVSLDLKDAHRIEGLKELNLTFMPHGLAGFRLQDLTKLTYQEYCTDADLKIIGDNCLKLEFLDISKSKKITDDGLRACTALSLYSKLRIVKISECCQLSKKYINDFLSENDAIQELYAWNEPAKAGFDCFSQSDGSVHQSATIFDMMLVNVTNTDLRTVIKKFPNLTELGIQSNTLADAIDWSMLRFLKRITRLSVNVDQGFSWHNLQPVLRFIGVNIISLRVSCANYGPSSCATQSDLDFLFEFCPNIESLAFDCRARSSGEPLVIPSFAKLKMLTILTPAKELYRAPVLEFGDMSKLEHLCIHRLALTVEIVESVVLDHAKFPNLVKLCFADFFGLRPGQIDHIKQLVKDNNLDLDLEFIQNCPMQNFIHVALRNNYIGRIGHIPIFFRYGAVRF